MDKIAIAMHSVTAAMAVPNTSNATELLTSPQHCTAAVCALEAEGDLSTNDSFSYSSITPQWPTHT